MPGVWSAPVRIPRHRRQRGAGDRSQGLPPPDPAPPLPSRLPMRLRARHRDRPGPKPVDRARPSSVSRWGLLCCWTITRARWCITCSTCHVRPRSSKTRWARWPAASSASQPLAAGRKHRRGDAAPRIGVAVSQGSGFCNYSRPGNRRQGHHRRVGTCSCACPVAWAFDHTGQAPTTTIRPTQALSAIA